MRDSTGGDFSAQEHPKIAIQEPISRVELLACRGECFQPFAERLLHDRPREAEGLIEQRTCVSIAAELIEALEEGLPTDFAISLRILTCIRVAQSERYSHWDNQHRVERGQGQDSQVKGSSPPRWSS